MVGHRHTPVVSAAINPAPRDQRVDNDFTYFVTPQVLASVGGSTG
jgi:hypothetical protein